MCEKTVLSASRPLRWCELDSRQLGTVADRKFEVRTRSEQSSNSHQTQHVQDRLVVSGVAVWTESARLPDKCVQRRSVSGGAGTAGATAGRTPTQNALVRRSGRLSSHGLTPRHMLCDILCSLSCRVWRAVWIGHYSSTLAASSGKCLCVGLVSVRFSVRLSVPYTSRARLLVIDRYLLAPPESISGQRLTLIAIRGTKIDTELCCNRYNI